MLDRAILRDQASGVTFQLLAARQSREYVFDNRSVRVKFCDVSAEIFVRLIPEQF